MDTIYLSELKKQGVRKITTDFEWRATSEGDYLRHFNDLTCEIRIESDNSGHSDLSINKNFFYEYLKSVSFETRTGYGDIYIRMIFDLKRATCLLEIEYSRIHQQKDFLGFEWEEKDDEEEIESDDDEYEDSDEYLVIINDTAYQCVEAIGPSPEIPRSVHNIKDMVSEEIYDDFTANALWCFKPNEYKRLPQQRLISFDGLVYYGGSDCLYAVNVSTGVQRWQYKTEHEYKGTIKVIGSTACFDDGTYLYAVDAATGEEHWKLKVSRQTSDSFIVSADENFVYICDAEYLCALDQNGQKQWQTQISTKVNEDDLISLKPILLSYKNESNLYISTKNGWKDTVLAIDLLNGEVCWSFEASYTIAWLEGDSKIVYVECTSGRLSALDIATGEELWRWYSWYNFSDSPQVCPPLLTEHYLYIPDSCWVDGDKIEAYGFLCDYPNDAVACVAGVSSRGKQWNALLTNVDQMHYFDGFIYIRESSNILEIDTQYYRPSRPPIEFSGEAYFFIEDHVYMIDGYGIRSVQLDYDHKSWFFEAESVLECDIEPLIIDKTTYVLDLNGSLYAIDGKLNLDSQDTKK